MDRTLTCLSLGSFCALLRSLETGEARGLRPCASLADVFDALWDESAGFDRVVAEVAPEEERDLRGLAECYPAVSFWVVGAGAAAGAGNVAAFASVAELLGHVARRPGVALRQAR